jgi:nickel/cobalt transporter (NiCoT) family protein
MWPRSPAATRGRPRASTRDGWLRLALFGAAIACPHLAGWGLFVYYSGRYQPLVGLGLTAYLFGLRHAFDADHIAAIDNTTRKLLAEERRPLGVGFFFSLGHVMVVLVLAGLLALATRTADTTIPALQHYGGYLSAGVSAGFLWAIGLLNLVVLVDIVRIFRDMRGGEYDDHGALDRRRARDRHGRSSPPSSRSRARSGTG